MPLSILMYIPTHIGASLAKEFNRVHPVVMTGLPQEVYLDSGPRFCYGTFCQIDLAGNKMKL